MEIYPHNPISSLTKKFNQQQKIQPISKLSKTNPTAQRHCFTVGNSAKQAGYDHNQPGKAAG